MDRPDQTGWPDPLAHVHINAARELAIEHLERAGYKVEHALFVVEGTRPHAEGEQNVFCGWASTGRRGADNGDLVRLAMWAIEGLWDADDTATSTSNPN
jgi:hypothetical protein